MGPWLQKSSSDPDYQKFHVRHPVGRTDFSLTSLGLRAEDPSIAGTPSLSPRKFSIGEP
jgi:hypothetical protein